MMTRRSLFKSTGAAGLMAVAGVAATQVSAQSMTVASSGMFEGRSNHITSGSVKIVEENGRRFVELGDDFSFDNGPDPHVAFGADGVYDPESELGALLEYTGGQRYAISSTKSIDEYNEVYIWCNVAGVPLGVASLS